MSKMTPRERVLAVLRGAPTDRVPFTIYERKIPQCAVERQLRNEGLCIVNRIRAYVTEHPHCATETRSYMENGKERIRWTMRTPVGELSSVINNG